MKIEHKAKLAGTLLVTHSGRITEPARCSVNHFTRRYRNPDRLDNIPNFEELPPEKVFQGYDGSVTFYNVFENDDGTIELARLGNIFKCDKIQHTVMLDERNILVGYESRLEVWELDKSIRQITKLHKNNIKLKRIIEHPFFPGLHTIFNMPDGKVILSCSASDAILIVDLDMGKVTNQIRMPADLYGSNYELTEGMDLREHYIHNDAQTTHINSACPSVDGSKVVVSALIPGAIGEYHLGTGEYKELIKGFLGCHGAKYNDEGQIYFSDSVNGNLIFLNSNGIIDYRFGVDSRWLHDVQQIKENIYSFTLADKNELQIWDVANEIILYKKKYLSWPDNRSRHIARLMGIWVGNSTQFLGYRNW